MTGAARKRRARGDLTHVALALCVVLAGGCHRTGDGRITDITGDGRVTITCFGDSNTALQGPKWCEYLQEKIKRWRFVNRGVNFAKACALASPEVLPKVQATLASDSPDAVVVALGTNDVDQPVEVVLGCLDALVTALRTLGLPEGVTRPVYILTIPRRTWLPALQPTVEAVNAALKTRYDGAVIETTNETLVADGLHLDDAAQHARAEAVWKALEN